MLWGIKVSFLLLFNFSLANVQFQSLNHYKTTLFLLRWDLLTACGQTACAQAISKGMFLQFEYLSPKWLNVFVRNRRRWIQFPDKCSMLRITSHHQLSQTTINTQFVEKKYISGNAIFVQFSCSPSIYWHYSSANFTPLELFSLTGINRPNLT